MKKDDGRRQLKLPASRTPDPREKDRRQTVVRAIRRLREDIGPVNVRLEDLLDEETDEPTTG